MSDIPPYKKLEKLPSDTTRQKILPSPIQIITSKAITQTDINFTRLKIHYEKFKDFKINIVKKGGKDKKDILVLTVRNGNTIELDNTHYLLKRIYIYFNAIHEIVKDSKEEGKIPSIEIVFQHETFTTDIDSKSPSFLNMSSILRRDDNTGGIANTNKPSNLLNAILKTLKKPGYLKKLKKSSKEVYSQQITLGDANNDFTDLLPLGFDKSYFEYDGSNPDGVSYSDTAVKWIVFNKINYVSRTIYSLFEKLNLGTPKSMDKIVKNTNQLTNYYVFYYPVITEERLDTELYRRIKPKIPSINKNSLSEVYPSKNNAKVTHKLNDWVYAVWDWITGVLSYMIGKFLWETLLFSLFMVISIILLVNIDFAAIEGLISGTIESDGIEGIEGIEPSSATELQEEL
jgi:hypothetical protein